MKKWSALFQLRLIKKTHERVYPREYTYQSEINRFPETHTNKSSFNSPSAYPVYFTMFASKLSPHHKG